MPTIAMLVCSNVFMTFAWYGHLKYPHWPLWQAILIAAFFMFRESRDKEKGRMRGTNLASAR
jgi:uncharacterized protein